MGNMEFQIKKIHIHSSGDGKLAIIHNGIIENYDSIKEIDF